MSVSLHREIKRAVWQRSVSIQWIDATQCMGATVMEGKVSIDIY